MRATVKKEFDSINQYRKAIRSKPLDISSPDIFDWIDNELSPENISCDGEASHAHVIRYSRFLNELKKEAMIAQGKLKVQTYKIGDMISFQDKVFKVLKVKKVNYLVEDVITSKRYNLKIDFNL
jgi:hypothetical protein